MVASLRRVLGEREYKIMTPHTFMIELYETYHLAGAANDCYAIGGAGLLVHPERDPSSNLINLDEIFTQERRQGHANWALRIFCELLDKHSVACALICDPFDPEWIVDSERMKLPATMNWKQLQTWYRRFGFKGSGKVMIRRPRPYVAVPAVESLDRGESFTAWRAATDAQLRVLFGLKIDNLPVYDWTADYRSGLTPEEAARAAAFHWIEQGEPAEVEHA